jgi:calpain-12
LRFFIRGKPWIVTIDDEVLTYDGNLNFAMLGESKNLWAPLMEKAFAKMKGNYATANGGFVPNGLRSLVGCPISDYLSEDQADYSLVWSEMKAADELDYILGAGTIGSDTEVNECNVVAGHAYSVIAVFELKTGETVDH